MYYTYDFLALFASDKGGFQNCVMIAFTKEIIKKTAYKNSDESER